MRLTLILGGRKLGEETSCYVYFLPLMELGKARAHLSGLEKLFVVSGCLTFSKGGGPDAKIVHLGIS